MKAGDPAVAPSLAGSRLFHKYAALLIVVVALSVIVTGLLHTWVSYNELRRLLLQTTAEQAVSAETRISQFVKEVEGHLSWATQLPARFKTEEEWKFDAARLFRQAPAVTEIAQLDAKGFELFRSSRQAMDVVGSRKDHSSTPAFIEASQHKSYYGPVYFVRESEPYMTIALAGPRADHGVVVAEVNLKFIWDIVSEIKIGEGGITYVTDSEGRLIAHPDISLVLGRTDLTRLTHVQLARSLPAGRQAETYNLTLNLAGDEVLVASSMINELGWLVFAELPAREVFAPLYDRLVQSGVLLVTGFGLAGLAGLFFARKMVIPIRLLAEGAKQLGRGDLGQRIAISTGDELEQLGRQFNQMAERLEESYQNLERKVDERTRQLKIATEAKSRFLATASHDLRQPLHALGLFVAQLRSRLSVQDRKKVLDRIETALSGMNELFTALLDVTRLDAGALQPTVREFPVDDILERIEATFLESAREKHLSLHVIRSSAWVRSDPLLVERIIANLVSNAIRYTRKGKILIGARRQGRWQLRLEVWDTGPGIPEDQREAIFGEFYRFKGEGHQPGGFGLGLAIVDRLSQLLGHLVTVESSVGKGSCFALTLPTVPAGRRGSRVASVVSKRIASGRNLIVVIDDDPMVLESMSGLIRSWGCDVVTGDTSAAVLARLKPNARPDAIISDYHLSSEKTGVDAIDELRGAFGSEIPAFLMSGDVNPEPSLRAQAKGYPLLHKPVEPMTLRATVNQVVAGRSPVPN